MTVFQKFYLQKQVAGRTQPAVCQGIIYNNILNDVIEGWNNSWRYLTEVKELKNLNDCKLNTFD